jgi:purine-binding chemotaxis protein CheW
MDELNSTVVSEADDTQNMYLTFAVGEDYGVGISYVTEIINVQAITEVPELPTYIKGIINLRGKIIPVMDVRVRFNKEPKAYNERTCIIVVDIGDTGIGLIVDMVREVLHIDEEEIVPPAEAGKEYGGNRYISGIARTGGQTKLLLDIERLVSDE